ncbi:hypothetical protein [Azoarcus sp. KH32C]|uniref:hypothetical protein n=1 Tax=Azoarcus sp. KH32C TaxID=748247 RepID=UPI0002385C0B|nr:hypothetical protein [Azoarcus sp. KH32C]BAL26838.1 conserved hypothetical protein [Azoarcus sp. KH32C]
MNTGDIRVGRVLLRGTASAIDAARATLPAALARAHWSDVADDAIVVVRRVAVAGTAAELPARAAAATEHLARRAADPWSSAADAADAVRFRNALDYRACLVRDLLAGTAHGRWLWRHRTALLARPAAEALAELLGEDALALPALLERPALRDSLPALWRTLDAPAARSVLHAIGTTTGWQSAITGALDPTPHERRAGARSASRRPALEAPPNTRSTARAPEPVAPTQTADSVFRSAALRAAPLRDLPSTDPRVVLQAVLALWTHAPAALASANAAETLRAAAETLLAPAATSTPNRHLDRLSHAGRGHHPADAQAPDPTQNAALRAPATAVSAHPTVAPYDPFASTDTPPDNTPPVAPRDASAPHRVSSVAASSATLPPAADHDFHTRGGGFFFLLNVLDLPALRDWRARLDEPQAGWRELVRLAATLGFTPDAPLAAFLADACALAPDDGSPDKPATTLTRLPRGPESGIVLHTTLRHYGETALRAALAERPAHVIATRSHVDIHLRLADVDLDIRRPGLDLDPGWLPWLGRVVHFHYDSGGFTS